MKLLLVAKRFEGLLKNGQDSDETFVVIVESTDGTHEVARASSLEGAREAAEKFLGRKGEWEKAGREESTISDYGDVVMIGPGRKKRTEKGKHLWHGWDYFFETGYGQDYIAKALGFETDDYGEIPYKDPRYKEWQNVIGKISRWLKDQLKDMGIEAYGIDNKIYVDDVKELANRAKSIPHVGAEVSVGFLNWANSA